MPEFGTYGSVPGAPSNGRPYGDHPKAVESLGADLSPGGVATATQTPTGGVSRVERLSWEVGGRKFRAAM